MKTNLRFSLCALTVGVLFCALPPEIRAASGPSTADVGEMATLEHFLELSDAELDQAQRVIARIRALGPAERAALRAEIARYRALPSQQRNHLRQGWGALDESLQDDWRRMMQQATPDRRAEIQERLQSLPPAEKAAYRRGLVEAFLATETKSRP